jgi:glycosyltransferase involved in cell wall biosynthesis
MARIALVVNAAWNVFNFRISLLEAIRAAGHEVIVIAPFDDYAERIPFPFYAIDITSRSTNPLVDARLFFDFLRVYTKSKPDILLLYTAKPNVYGNFAARLLGIRSISNVAGLGGVFVQQGLLAKILKSLYRVSLKVPDFVFFQNREDKTQFLEEGIVTPSKANLLPGSGVDLTRFNITEGSHWRDHRTFVFLLSARMLWDKGIAEYVSAAEKLLSEGVDAEFRLIGFLDSDNPTAIGVEDMEKLTAHPRINYRGVSDQMELEIAEADCYVLPTLYKEGTPKSVLEAAAMGKPLITTDAPGCRDIVDDGINGFLWRPKDIEHLYELMKKMIGLTDKQRSEMGHKGRDKIVREFDDKIVIRKYLNAIDTILNRPKKNC